MTFSVQTIGCKCRNHDEDESDFCGEAAVMMICSNRQVSLSKLDQYCLASLAHEEALSPESLVTLLNSRLPDHAFVLKKAADATEAMEGIASALEMNQVPVAVLTNSGTHWDVAAAVVLSIGPNGQKNVEQVYFNCPVPLDNPPKPHSLDDICASHLAVPANAFEPATDWKDGWLTPDSDTQVIAYVCSTLSRAQLKGHTAPSYKTAFITNALASVSIDTAQPSKAVKEQSADEIVKVCRAGLASMPTLDPDGRNAWQLLENPTAGTPLRVERLDREDHYFIVPWKVNGLVLVTTTVSASTGSFTGAYFHGRRWYPELADPTLELASQASLGWKPCKESFSPHFPFLLPRAPTKPSSAAANSGGQTPAPSPTDTGGGKYVRLDGAEFSSLTPGTSLSSS